MTNRQAINVMGKYTGETISPVVVEAHRMAIAALEKQEPAPVREFNDHTAKCPVCRNWIPQGDEFCSKCGQAIKVIGGVE